MFPQRSTIDSRVLTTALLTGKLEASSLTNWHLGRPSRSETGSIDPQTIALGDPSMEEGKEWEEGEEEVIHLSKEKEREHTQLKWPPHSAVQLMGHMFDD